MPAATADAPTRRSLDVYAAALDGTPVALRREAAGRAEVTLLPAARWLGPARLADLTVLSRLHGPVLDVGCGPGRFVTALAARGVPVLGVDIAPAAVRRTRAAGGMALLRSVYDPIPGTGRWRSVLLLDGNIGIGGDPQRLLGRCAGLVAPGGQVLVELAGRGLSRHRVRLETAAAVGEWFPWAVVGADAAAHLAAAVGLRVVEQWSAPDSARLRSFARLRTAAAA